jgi:hypothetical protein
MESPTIIWNHPVIDTEREGKARMIHDYNERDVTEDVQKEPEIKHTEAEYEERTNIL